MVQKSDPVVELIESVGDDGRRGDAYQLLALMEETTGEAPRLWNDNTIGFGEYHYRYASGQEGEFFLVGFAPRDDRITLYIMSGLRGFEEILDRLGPHRASKSAVHLKRFADVDDDALRELISECVAHLERVEREIGAIPRMSEIPPRLPPQER